MAKKTAARKPAPVQQLAKETDKLAVQADKTKKQMDKVQTVADTVVHQAKDVRKKAS
jgi:hypothetical protein